MKVAVWNTALWNIGWIVVACAWLGPLPQMAQTSFAAHMTLHMAIVAVAAPLIAIGMAGRRFDPVTRYPAWFPAIPASVGELIIVWAWHSPGLHHWARFSNIGFAIEQSMFLASGLWIWLAAFGGTQPRSRRRSAAGVIGLLLTSMHMTLLGALLALSPRLLFDHSHHGMTTSPLFDQQIGGTVMLVVGGIAYLCGGLWLTKDLVGDSVLSRDTGWGDNTQYKSFYRAAVHSEAKS